MPESISDYPIHLKYVLSFSDLYFTPEQALIMQILLVSDFATYDELVEKCNIDRKNISRSIEILSRNSFIQHVAIIGKKTDTNLPTKTEFYYIDLENVILVIQDYFDAVLKEYEKERTEISNCGQYKCENSICDERYVATDVFALMDFESNELKCKVCKSIVEPIRVIDGLQRKIQELSVFNQIRWNFQMMYDQIKDITLPKHMIKPELNRDHKKTKVEEEENTIIPENYHIQKPVNIEIPVWVTQEAVQDKPKEDIKEKPQEKTEITAGRVAGSLNSNIENVSSLLMSFEFDYNKTPSAFHENNYKKFRDQLFYEFKPPIEQLTQTLDVALHHIEELNNDIDYIDDNTKELKSAVKMYEHIILNR